MLVLEIEPIEVQYYYSFTCLTAPFLGVTVGGIVFQWLGGYNAPKSILLVNIIAFFAIISALPVPFLSHKDTVYFLLWALLFFGASMLPTITGMMLNAVKESDRATANSIAVLIYNMTGYLPAPFIYGWVSTLGIDENNPDKEAVLQQSRRASRAALCVIMFWTLISVGCYMVAAYLKLNQMLKGM
jgi:MFS family permease